MGHYIKAFPVGSVKDRNYGSIVCNDAETVQVQA